VAKAAPLVTKDNRFAPLDEVNLDNTHVDTDSDIYIENGTSLRKDIHDYLVASVEKGQKIRILENQNRKRNLKNKRMDEANKRWSAYKKAPGTQTSEKNTETKKGDDVAEAQSSSEEEAPKKRKEFPKAWDLPYHPDAPKEGEDVVVMPDWNNPKNGAYRTRLPFGMRRKEAMKWLMNKTIGVAQENKLKEELRELQKQRKHHEMLVPITLTTLDTGKTRTIRALLDSGCTSSCIDRDYAKAEGIEQHPLDKPIIARNQTEQRTQEEGSPITWS
jgi:hypothetical protein